jgi:hypothetical protein
VPLVEKARRHRASVFGIALDAAPAQARNQVERARQGGRAHTRAAVPLAHVAARDPPVRRPTVAPADHPPRRDGAWPITTQRWLADIALPDPSRRLYLCRVGFGSTVPVRRSVQRLCQTILDVLSPTTKLSRQLPVSSVQNDGQMTVK